MINKVKLANGMEIPAMAFGTYKTGDPNKDIHKMAIEAGYRYFDTASIYETERSLGKAVKESGLKRDEFIIQTKLWYDERGYKEAREALMRSLDRLSMDYVDIYLIHWPRTPKDTESQWRERNKESWRAMQELKKEGLVKALGFSNFLPHHIEAVGTGDFPEPPVLDQLELHVGYGQHNAVDHCKKNNIIPQAWSPLIRGKLGDEKAAGIIDNMAHKYGRSGTQICLRYLIERGIVPVVKSSTPEHMRDNLGAFDFTLSGDDMSLLESFPYSTWLGEHPDFSIPENHVNQDQ